MNTQRRLYVLAGLVLILSCMISCKPLFAQSTAGKATTTVTVTGVSTSANQTNGNGIVALDTLSTARGALTCQSITTASDNATNCKASAGNVYMVAIQNPTGSFACLRMYNLSTTPTSSSATGYKNSVSSSAGLPAGYAFAPGQAFSAGIGFVVTGGVAGICTTTDSSSAPAGVTVTILYQ